MHVVVYNPFSISSLHLTISSSHLGRSKQNEVQDDKRQAYLDSCERNAVEGEFGTGKRRYGLNCIINNTSECVIAIHFLSRIWWVFSFYLLLTDHSVFPMYSSISLLASPFFWENNSTALKIILKSRNKHLSLIYWLSKNALSSIVVLLLLLICHSPVNPGLTDM